MLTIAYHLLQTMALRTPGGAVDRKLLKQFNADAGLAFLDVIREASRPVRAQEIKAEIVAAGGPTAEVDRKWKALQPHIRLHPRIDKTPNHAYEWVMEPRSSADSLNRLSANSARRIPAWLTQAHVANVSDSLALAEAAGPRGSTGWTRQRELSKAVLLAEILAEAEVAVDRGNGVTELARFIRKKADEAGLEPVGHRGERQPFDPHVHEPDHGVRPRPGDAVAVQRCGYVWTGGGDPVVAVKALVTM
jgi:hypothetical protein